MRRIVVICAALLAASLLAGCGSKGTATTATGASTSASATASTSPTPSISPTPELTKDQIAALVDRVGPAKSAVGADTETQDKGLYTIPLPCPNDTDQVANIAWAHFWYWGGGTVRYAEEDAIGVTRPEAKFVVASIQGFAHSCQTYPLTDNGGTYTVAMAGDDAITTPSGVDGAYAWCELSTELTPAKYKGHQTMFCSALFSRGPVFIRLRVYGDQPTLASAEAKLAKVIDGAVPAFVAAVPAP